MYMPGGVDWAGFGLSYAAGWEEGLLPGQRLARDGAFGRPALKWSS